MSTIYDYDRRKRFERDLYELIKNKKIKELVNYVTILMTNDNELKHLPQHTEKTLKIPIGVYEGTLKVVYSNKIKEVANRYDLENPIIWLRIYSYKDKNNGQLTTEVNIYATEIKFKEIGRKRNKRKSYKINTIVYN